MDKKYLFIKNSLLIFSYIILMSTTYGQELHVISGGQITISAGNALYVNNNASISGTGALNIKSDIISSGSLLVTGNVTGNISYSRYIKNLNWHLVAAPVTNQSIPDFVAEASNKINSNPVNGNYAIAYYKNTNPSGNRWTYHNDAPTGTGQETLTNFETGKGYSTNATIAGEFNFTGNMNTSDEVVVNLNTASGTHYWNSIGNPYPSFLPANANASAQNIFSQNIDALDPSFAALYLWNGTVYEAINNSLTSLHLSPGQAFMVLPKDNTETFTFRENLQTHQDGIINFYKTSNNTAEITVSLSNGDQSRSTQIKYLENTTTGLDVGYDAGAYQDGTPSFSLNTHLVSQSQGIDFTLQCLPENSYENLVIPLSVREEANKTLVFSATKFNLPNNVDVYLEDVVANTYNKISDTSYQVTLKFALSGIGRFYLHTSAKNVLGLDDTKELNSINIYKTGSENLRITGLESNQNSSIQMFDITGKEVMFFPFKSERVQDIKLPKLFSTGVYVLKLISKDKIISKKLIIE